MADDPHAHSFSPSWPAQGGPPRPSKSGASRRSSLGLQVSAATTLNTYLPHLWPDAGDATRAAVEQALGAGRAADSRRAEDRGVSA